MRDRNIACIHYQYEKSCDLGREGTFYHYCQKCKMYNARRGAEPARLNLKREKIERARKRDENV